MFMARSAPGRALPVAGSLAAGLRSLAAGLRPLAAALLVGVVGLAGGGCSNDGSYQVSWKFTNAFMSGACGKAGVSGISIAATEAGGGQSSQAVVCGPGTFTGKLSKGTWSLALTALDAEGNVMEPAPSPLLRGAVPAPIDVTDGELTVVADRVVLPPLPECRDGVDNDHDGRVDLDDLDCAGNPEGAAECVAGAGLPACPDSTP
jgi:hypothetical protein